MSRWRAAAPPAVASVLALALVLTAGCSSSSRRADPAAGTGSAAGGSGGGDDRRWVADDAATADELAAARTAVAARLVRLGVPSPGVAAADGGLRTATAVDPVLREAAGRRGATELWTVTATTVGACPAGGAGLPSSPPGPRCHTLGVRVAGVEAVRSAQAELQPGIGWGVELFVDPAGYAGLRQALATTAGTPVAGWPTTPWSA